MILPDHFQIAQDLFKEIHDQFESWYREILEVEGSKMRSCLKSRLEQRQRRFTQHDWQFQGLCAEYAAKMHHLPSEAKREAKRLWVWAYENWHATRPLCASDVKSTLERIRNKKVE